MMSPSELSPHSLTATHEVHAVAFEYMISWQMVLAMVRAPDIDLVVLWQGSSHHSSISTVTSG
jgi:hypothetical protein